MRNGYSIVTVCDVLDVYITECIVMFIRVKDRIVKQNLIRAVELIGQAMHPSHLKTNFSFSQRNGLLQHMKVGILLTLHIV